MSGQARAQRVLCIGYLFYANGIYVLDMCFLFPVFIIIAIMATKKRRLRFIIDFHYLYLGTLLFSVALGGILKPLYNQAGDAGEIWLYLGMSAIFLALAVIYLRNLKIVDKSISGN